MRRPLFLGLITTLLVLAGILLLNGPLLGLAVPLAIYLLVGWWSGERPPALVVRRTISEERVLPGTPVNVTLQVENHGAALEEVTVAEIAPADVELLEGSARRMFWLPAGGSGTLTCTFRGGRGYYPMQHVTVSTSDHFGLLPLQARLATDGQLFILPPTSRLRRIEIRPRRTRIYSGSIPAREGGPGVEFFSVRNYENGDSLRWINWRLSARHPETLFTNEFEQERVADVGIILDARIATNLFGGGRSIFEHSALAAASLADAFLGAGNRVGLLIYGRYAQWTMPGYGKLQRERILQAIARAELVEAYFWGLIIPRRLFPPYSQMVLISPLQNDDAETLFSLRSMGYQVLLVAPDPVRFELSHLPDTPSTRLAARIVRLERSLLLRRIRRSGVQVVDWDVSVPFEQVVSAALSRPPSYLRAITWGGLT